MLRYAKIGKSAYIVGRVYVHAQAYLMHASRKQTQAPDTNEKSNNLDAFSDQVGGAKGKMRAEKQMIDPQQISAGAQRSLNGILHDECCRTTIKLA